MSNDASQGSRAEQYDLLWFAGEMAKKLDENSHKCGWDDIDLDYAMMRLKQEVGELNGAVYETMCEIKPPDVVAREIIREAADVANFAFMIAYKAR